MDTWQSLRNPPTKTDGLEIVFFDASKFLQLRLFEFFKQIFMLFIPLNSVKRKMEFLKKRVLSLTGLIQNIGI